MKDLNTARKFAARLLGEGPACESFLASLLAGKSRSPSLVWTGEPRVSTLPEEWISDEPVPGWLPEWVSMVSRGVKTGTHPLFEEGAYYPADFSSVWAASAMLAVGGVVKAILDVCAAPGGKTIMASRFLCPELLLSNEVIGKRLGILRYNLGRCGIPNAFTQRLDPSELADACGGSFDLVIVDAPCSGQSLVARGMENPGCFHPKLIKKNARRQRRVLAESVKCVAPGGHVLYTTCTFAREENEGIVQWLIDQEPGINPVEVPHLDPWRSGFADFPCYRLYPQDGIGAGGFAALLRREGEGAPQSIDPEILKYPVEPSRTNEEGGS